MRMILVVAFGLSLFGCDKADSGPLPKPFWISLNPNNRTYKTGSEAAGPNTPAEDIVGGGGIESAGAKGEWRTGLALWAGGRDKDPHIVMRFYDADRAVRVEVTFKGPAPRVLKTVAFRHVTESEGFKLKTAKGESTYSGHSQQGEDLLLRWPEEGDGTVTFLAHPHVH